MRKYKHNRRKEKTFRCEMVRNGLLRVNLEESESQFSVRNPHFPAPNGEQGTAPPDLGTPRPDGFAPQELHLALQIADKKKAISSKEIAFMMQI